MKIQVGIGNKKEFEYFLKEGADEFYAGLSFLPSHLYGGENFKSTEELIDVIKIAKDNGKKFYLVINEVSDADLNEVFFYLKNLDKKIKLDGFILRDVQVIKEIHKTLPKKYLILSSLALCFSEKALKFYSEIGINRICLPEHIIPSEAEKLIKNKYGVDVEMFVTALEFCLVFNGFCYLKQFNDKCICRDGFRNKVGQIFSLPRFSVEEHFRNIYDFYNMGVNIIKIGRGPDNIYACFVIHEIKYLINLLKRSGKDNFVKKATDFHIRYRNKIFQKLKNIKKK
jgi:hypothetical protein